MNIIVVPDSFKGSIRAVEAAGIIADELKKRIPGASVAEIPVADGGEGTLECFSRFLGGKMIETEVTGPNFQKINAGFLLCGKTAVIEMALAAGLPIASPKSAGATTTFGVGELMLEAEKNGAEKFILGIGGSATNDGGCGMAAALGTVFLDENGESFVPVGETLGRISKTIPSQKRDITVLCDVKNPLFGENGAAYVYAPQKGATPQDVVMLDSGLRSLAAVFGAEGERLAYVPGAGAAGGMGFGLMAFCGAKLRRGIEAVLELAGFDEKIKTADAVVTGEGSLDSQSFSGKVIDGIIGRSGKTPVFAVVGISKLENFAVHGLSGVFETNPEHLPFEVILPNAKADLKKAAARLAEHLNNCKFQ